MTAAIATGLADATSHYGPDCFMAEDAAALDLRDISLEDMQVGTAEGDRVDADASLGGLSSGRTTSVQSR